MIFKKVWLLLVFSILISACAAPTQRLQTVSGNPEIVIPDVKIKQVIDQIVFRKLEKGMQIKNVNDYGVTVSKRIDDSFMASFLYGSRYDSNPEARITYNVVEQGTSVKVFSRIEIITNPGSGFEKSSDATASLAIQMQSELDQLKGRFSK